MKKFKVTYRAKDEDYTSVWVYANDRNSAEEEARGEYWDIQEIIDIHEI